MFVQLTKDFLGRKPGERIDVSDADANALVTQGIAAAVSDDVLTPVLARAFDGLAQKLTTTIDQTLKQFADVQTRSRRQAVPAIFGARGDGDPRRTFGDWLLAVRRGDVKRLTDTYGSQFADWTGDASQKAALNTQTGYQGGYTVPTDFLPRLLEISAESSVIEPRATRIPMASQRVQVPALDVTTAPTAGETAFFGGLQANWTEESATLGEEEPTFKQIELIAHELSGYTLASNTLLQDAGIGLEALLLQLFGRALGWHKDYAFLRGNGAGKPLGVLNSGALISVTRSGASAFTLADAAGMLGRLLPGWSPRSTVWAMHPTLLVKLYTMVGGGTGSDVVFIENAREKPQMTLFGIPIQVTEKLPALNTLGDALLIDCRHYLVGDREQIEIAYSDHVKFLTNQGAWRFCARVDGQPWLRSAITLSDASSTLSPFVGLAAG